MALYRNDGDTIFAVASGTGRSAVAVMRISGPDTARLVQELGGRRTPERRASLCRLRDIRGETLDRALVLWFPGPASYTGEDSAELHLHGGHAVLDGVANALVEMGAFPAEAGEFTRRAFLNGRMDLVGAEAVADLIAAETSAQRRQALRQLEGALGDLYRGWSSRLLRLTSQQEALIDFPDEDLPPEVERGVINEIESLRREILAHIDDNRRGERLRDGLVFAVTGPPNVGKSSLVNALARRDVAIVAPSAGTTRDVAEVRIVLGDVPVTLLDTAGLRATDDPVEAEGVRRAVARAETADVVVRVVDASDNEGGWRRPGAVTPFAGATIVVANKADATLERPADAVCVSALTGMGLDQLRDALAVLARRLTGASGPPALTRVRHRAALVEAAARLGSAGSATLPELRAEDLRLSLRAVGTVTGAVAVEDILDSVFRQFCIGK